MIGINSLSVIVFVVLLCLFLYLKRSKISWQKPFFPFIYIILYRTAFGIKAMDKISKKLPVFWRLFGYASIFFGFVGLVVICFALIHSAYKAFLAPAAVAGVALVLPIKAKGIFYVPFLYWVISIFILAVIHESAHGIVARLHKVNLKSAGFAFFSIFLPIIPAAFVEPDEKQLKKKQIKKQLAVFAAGPFANIVFGLIVLGIFVQATPPVVNALVEPGGVMIEGVDKGFAAEKAGLVEGEQVMALDNITSTSLDDFTSYLATKKPGDTLIITTNTTTYTATLDANPGNASKAFLGVYVAQKTIPKQNISPLLVSVVLWIIGLMYWLYILNTGIGLFNLAPIGPLDGGRMTQLVSHKLFGEIKGNKVWKSVSVVFLFFVVVNLAVAFLK